jgi:hypothetical protein
MVDVQLKEGFGRMGGLHAADEIVHKKVNEPFALAGVVGGVVNTALVVLSHGDHGGGSKRSRRYQREGVKEK